MSLCIKRQLYFLTKIYLIKKDISVTNNDYGNWFEFSFTEIYIYNDHTRFVVSWWGIYSYLNNEKFKQGMLYLWIMRMVNQDHLDQGLGQNLLNVTHIHI